MRFYHRTTAKRARAILKRGFRDSRGGYLTEGLHVGVWLADRPLDCNDGAHRAGALLAVDLDARGVRRYEWVEDGKGYREWLAPAEIVNQRATVHLIDS